jgi:hypothetical protein
MKKSFLKKFKGASLLTREETKTISGGYNIGGNPCTQPLCTQVYSSVLYMCGTAKVYYGMTMSYPYPTECKVF